MKYNQIPFRFGDWLFYAEKNQLCNTVTEECVELEFKVASLLLFFCEHPQQICQKDEIFNTLWPDRVVNDDSLSVAVSKLRKLLGDSARSATYVKTIPGQGYQFLQPVTQPTQTPQVIDKSTKRLSKQALGLVGCVIVGMLVWLYMPGGTNNLTSLGTVQAETTAQLAAINRALDKADKAEQLKLIDQLQDIIKQAPFAADAYVLLLEAKYSYVMRYHVYDLPLYRDEFVALAEKALHIEPDNPKALALRARIAMALEWDFAAAGEYHQRAHSLAPDDYGITQEYAEFMFFLSRKETGLALLDELRVKQPELYNSPAIPYMYLIAGEDEQAYKEIRAQLHSQTPTELHWVIAQRIGVQVGEAEMAAEALFSLLPLRGFEQAEIEQLHTIYVQEGLKGVYRELLRREESRYVGQYQGALAFARYALLSEQPEKALPYIKQSFKDRYIGVLWLDIDPVYSVLNQYPDYQALKNELNRLRNDVKI